MKRVALVRWALFLTVGLSFQVLLYALYPLAWAYWRMFIFKKGPKLVPTHWAPTDPNVGRTTRLNGALLDNDDDHGALSQYGFIGKEGMELLLDAEGNFVRRINDDGSKGMWWVSGDTVTCWCFAFVQMPEDQKPHEAARKAAWNYLKYLGTRSFDEKNKGWVSDRVSNFGLSYCPDSQALGLSAPSAAPQVWTSSSLFACASQSSKFWKLVFWVHWIVMGCWYWPMWPAIYPKDSYWYVRDVTMKMLWVHREVLGPRWWIKMAMKRINETVPNRNSLFEAMLGNDPGQMPDVMHAFFSQEKDATSSKQLFDGNNRASAFIPDAIRKIYLKARGGAS